VTAPEYESRLTPDTEHRIDDQIEELMTHYGGALLRFLILLVGDRDVAEDCAQDTFIRAYDNLQKGKPVNVHWLYKVARNRALDELQHRRREHAPPEAVGELVAVQHSESARTAAARRALDQLSPSDREILYLFTVDRFKTADIATMLGIRPEAARVRLMRARQRFRLLYGAAP
jgi:RNA polymerase sigma factor (sigma-70 family)